VRERGDCRYAIVRSAPLDAHGALLPRVVHEGDRGLTLTQVRRPRLDGAVAHDHVRVLAVAHRPGHKQASDPHAERRGDVLTAPQRHALRALLAGLEDELREDVRPLRRRAEAEGRELRAPNGRVGAQHELDGRAQILLELGLAGRAAPLAVHVREGMRSAVRHHARGTHQVPDELEQPHVRGVEHRVQDGVARRLPSVGELVGAHPRERARRRVQQGVRDAPHDRRREAVGHETLGAGPDEGALLLAGRVRCVVRVPAPALDHGVDVAVHAVEGSPQPLPDLHGHRDAPHKPPRDDGDLVHQVRAAVRARRELHAVP
jgi:hypothetical protein